MLYVQAQLNQTSIETIIPNTNPDANVLSQISNSKLTATIEILYTSEDP